MAKAEVWCGFIQLWIINSLWHKETEGPIMTVVKCKCEGPFQATDIDTAKISKIGQGIVLVLHSNVLWTNPMNELLIFEKAESFCNEVEITDKKRFRKYLLICSLSHCEWPSEQISFIMTMRLPILQLSCRHFWQNITSPRSVSTPTAQIWLSVTSGFSQS